MKKLRRTICWALATGLLGAAGCSEPLAETAPDAAEARPSQVIIGCTEAGAGMQSRTELAADGLTVNWTKGDEIRLWARPAERDAANQPQAFLLENNAFAFNYFSPSKTHAAFAGDAVLTEFDAEQRYDYYALYPAPAEGAVEGTTATYELPAIQTGVYDPSLDILTASQRGPALQAGDNNPYIRLPFEHHMHLLKFTIPQNSLEEAITGIELTFPRPVAGQVQVDVEAGTMTPVEGAFATTTIQVDFSAAPKDAGDAFFVLIPPMSFDAQEQIDMRIMGSTGETSVAYVFPEARDFACGHTTPVKLYVPEMQVAYTIVKFQVLDNDREEFRQSETPVENRFGVNTLGERVKSVTLRAQDGSAVFSKVIRTEPLSVEFAINADSTEMTLSVPELSAEGADFDGVYSITYSLRRRDVCPLSEKRLEVVYDSERALIQTDDYGEVAVDAGTIVFHQLTPDPIPLSVPYLFEEDFSRMEDNEEYDSEHGNTGMTGSKTSHSFLNDTWSGARIGLSKSTAIRLASYCNNVYLLVSNTTNICPARVDAAPLSHLKGTATVSLQFNYGMNEQRTGGSSIGQTFYVGRTETPGSDSEDTVGEYFDEYHFDEDTGSYTNLPNLYTSPSDKYIEGCSKDSRITIRTVPDDPGRNANHMCWLYIDNVKVKLAPAE